MKVIQGMVQGDPAWHAHRASHFNASDAPAMLGVSPYKTRAQLLDERATGATQDVDAATQRRFDEGHRFEALARPLAEKIIGEELFPCVGEEGKLSASFDGLTMDGSTGWEHKRLNEKIRDAIDSSTGNAICLPEYLRVQMEQQHMVSGCERILFMASDWDGDTLKEERHCWYYPDPELRNRIAQGWCQFAEDLANHVHEESAAPAPAGKAPDQLPALRIEVTGMVTASNLAEYREHALSVIGAINTDLQTDEDFANAEKTVKWCADVEDRIKGAKQHALSQTASIDELFRTMDAISEETRSKRLELDKLVKHRKESIRTEIAYAGRNAIVAHYVTMNESLKEHAIGVPASIGADLNAAIKGKRTVSSIRDAVDTVVANAKIAASQRADAVRACIAVLGESYVGHEALFPDAVVLCATKQPDDLRNLVKLRISEIEAAQKAKAEAEAEAARETIRAEEVAKLCAEHAKASQEPEPAAPKAAEPATSAPARVVQSSPTTGHRTPVKTRPTDREIIDVLTLHYRVHDSNVIEWLLAMDLDAATQELAA